MEARIACGKPRWDAIILTMLSSALRVLAFLPLLTLLASCAFFGTPTVPVGPGTPPTELSCGDVWTVDGLTGADAVALNIANQTNFELVADFGNPTLSMRLSRDTGSALERSLLLWDPVGERVLIPGAQNSDDDLQIELLGTSSIFSGTVSVDCSQPAESCFTLTDDDGDGDISCADLNCAWDSGCTEDQEIFTDLEVSCDDGALSLTTALATTDKQHTIYRTLPASESVAGLEFWGGAELMIREAAAGVLAIEITPGSPGLICFPGSSQSLDVETLPCENSEETTGASFIITPDQLPIILEPLAAGWSNLQIIPDCTTR